MNKTKIVLIIANVILGTYIFITFKTKVNPDEKIAVNILETLKNLDNIEIHSRGSDAKISIHKVEDKWIIKHPIMWESETLIISNFITKLAHSSPTYIINTSEMYNRGEKLSDYGIEENSTEVKLFGGRQQMNFVIGKETRDEENIYVQFKDNLESSKDTIWKLSKDVIDLLVPNPEFWSKSTFINTPLYGIDKIVLKKTESDNRITETELNKVDNKWQFTLPAEGPANQEAINNVLNQIISSRIENFILEQNKSIVLEELYELEVFGLGNKEIVSFFKTSTGGDVYCRSSNSNAIFKTNIKVLNLLMEWYSKYSDNKLLKQARDKVEEIYLKSNSFNLKIIKEKQKDWLLSNLDDQFYSTQKADTAEVEKLLNITYDITIDNIIPKNTNKDKSLFIDQNQDCVELTLSFIDGEKFSIIAAKERFINDKHKAYIPKINKQAIINIQNNFFLVNRHSLRNKSILDSLDGNIEIEVSSMDSNESNNVKKYKQTEEPELFNVLNIDKFLDTSYDPNGIWYDGDCVPWEYKLKLNGINSNVLKLCIAELNESKKWLGGLDDSNETFILNNKFGVILKNHFEKNVKVIINGEK